MKERGRRGGEENIYTYTKLKLWNVGKLARAELLWFNICMCFLLQDCGLLLTARARTTPRAEEPQRVWSHTTHVKRIEVSRSFW